MSGLVVSDIHLDLGGVPVLDGVSLHVGPREFVSVLGPSGAGKSSLFRLMTGALGTDRGAITLDGVPLDAARRPFAFMPQRDALMP